LQLRQDLKISVTVFPPKQDFFGQLNHAVHSPVKKSSDFMDSEQSLEISWMALIMTNS